MSMRLPRLPERPLTIVDDRTLFYNDKVLLTKDAVWTPVEIPLVPWGFQDHQPRLDLGWSSTLSLAAMKSGRCHLKITRTPLSAINWRRAAAEETARVGRPSPFYPTYADGQARQIEAAQPAEKHVILFRRLGSRNPWQRAIADAATSIHDGGRAARLPGSWKDDVPRRLTAEADRWGEQADEVRETLRRGGFHAQPVNAVDLRAYRRHSIQRGLVSSRPSADPGPRWPWDAREEFIDLEMIPLGDGVRIDSATGPVYSAALVAAHFPQEVEYPHISPWLAHIDRIGDWCEADVYFDLIPPVVAKRHLTYRQRLANEQREEAAAVGMDLPIENVEMIKLARELQYVVPRRRMPLAYTWAVIRVDASSHEELRYRVARTVERFADEDSPLIDLHMPTGMSQVDLLLQGNPGSPIRFKSFRQRMMVETLACGLPQAGSRLGLDPGGFFAGRTTGTHSEAVAINLHAPITRRSEVDVETSGTALFTGKPRSGKSNALGTCIYDADVRGLTTIAIDFSDRLAKLADLPETRIQVLNLVKSDQGPILDPMSPFVIPGNAQSSLRVRQARNTLARDTLQTIAWEHLVGNREGTTELLRAIVEVGSRPNPSTPAILKYLLRPNGPREATALGEFLTFELAGEESSVLLSDGDPRRPIDQDEPITRLFTAPGIHLPAPGVATSDFTQPERLGQAMFGVCVALAHRLLWDLPPDRLKLFAIDEAHVALNSAPGRRVIDAEVRHGPKNGTATLLATHQVSDLAHLGWLMNALAIRCQFRSTDPEELAVALPRALDVEDTPSNRARVSRFANGECLIVNHVNVRDRLQWSQWNQPLADALRTTPTGDLNLGATR